MNCCNKNSQKPCLAQESSITRIEVTSSSNSTSINQINSGFQFDSGFCQFCGVDVSLFSHEFWCKLASS